jgi:hypothetical protein
MLTKEKRAAFNSIMDGYTRTPHFDSPPYDSIMGDGDELAGFEDAPGASMSENEWDIDDEQFAEGFTLPITPFTEDDLRFLRDFILSSAMYVEQLESLLCDTSDDFWEAREQAYRIITALLIRHYEYELEG